MTLAHPDNVGELLKAVAGAVIMPRFRSLDISDVMEKSVGELVTVADREAENALGQGLLRILPSARLIGEEACAEHPQLLATLSDGLVWLIDPIDGTGNFAAGRPPFAVMVALLEHGITRQSWILDPLTETLWHAELGAGAYRDGMPVATDRTDPDVSHVVGILSEAFLPADRQGLGGTLRARFGSVLPTQRCAGHEYPLVAKGERDFAIYWRTLPWDHAAGALFLAEAGGRVIHFDGTPFTPSVQRAGLILARNQHIAERLLQIIAEE